jgi:hypothetical protein
VAVVVIGVAVAWVAACGPAVTPSQSPQGSGRGISIPTEQLTALDQCMFEHGFWITEVHEPSFEGDKPWYTWESDYSAEEGFAIVVECRDTFSPRREKTEAELRDIYDRWVAERDCLVELGYRPAEPPSFEKFVSDWRSVGPWMPNDGVDTEHWTDAEYREAKERCTLEMYDRS